MEKNTYKFWWSWTRWSQPLIIDKRSFSCFKTLLHWVYFSSHHWNANNWVTLILFALGWAQIGCKTGLQKAWLCKVSFHLELWRVLQPCSSLEPNSKLYWLCAPGIRRNMTSLTLGTLLQKWGSWEPLSRAQTFHINDFF